MPRWLLDCYTAMLPRLQAEEQLDAVTAAGASRMKPQPYRQMVQRLQRKARPHGRPHKVTRDSAAQLASMGIAVEVVKKGGDA